MELPFDPVVPHWEYTLRIPKHQFKRTYAPLCSHYVQQPRVGNSLSAHQQMSELKNCGVFINGILCNRKKEGGIPTLCDGTDGTGVYHARQNRPFSERQIPHDLTYKRNRMNKIN